MKTMTLDEMKLAVCRKLPELIIYTGNQSSESYSLCWIGRYEINWKNEGLQVCHEAEKFLNFSDKTRQKYVNYLREQYGEYGCVFTTYEQRLEALCRVWFPENFI